MLRVLRAPQGSSLTRGTCLAIPTPVVVVGRSPDADVVLADATVSRHHLRIEAGPPVSVQALTASNGTFLDGEPLGLDAPAVVPPDGARLQLGGVVLALVPMAETVPVVEALGPSSTGPVSAGVALLVVQWDAGQCVVRCGGRDLGLTGAAARFLGILAGQTGEVVHHWDLHDELHTTHLAPLATAVRQALLAAVNAGHLQADMLRDRVRAAAVASEGSEGSDLAELMRSVVQSRRGHGYVLHLARDDVAIVRV